MSFYPSSLKSLLGNLIPLLTGSLAGRLIQIAALPLLVRVYTSGEIGLSSVQLGLIFLVGSLSTFGYDIAVLLPRTERQVLGLYFSSNLLSLFFGPIIVVVVYLVGGAYLAKHLALTRAGLYVIGIGVIAEGVSLLIQALAMQRQRFSLVGTARGVAAVSVVACQLALSPWFGVVGLVVGVITGRIVQTVIICWFVEIPWDRAKRLLSRRGLKLVTALLARHKQFPIYQNWNRVLFQISQSAPPWLLTLYFGPDIAGLFFLVDRVLGVPVQALGEPLRKVFLQHIASRKNRGERVLRSGLELFFILNAMMLIPGVLVYFGADMFADIVFGTGWSGVGSMMILLLPIYWLRFVVNPLAITLSVFDLQNLSMLWQLLFAVASVVSFQFFSHGPARVALGYYTISTSCVFVLMTISTFGVLWNHDSKLALRSTIAADVGNVPDVSGVEK